MRLVPRLLREWAKPEYRTTLANPSPLLLEAFGVHASFTGERVTVAKAIELGAVRAAVSMISEAVGGLPLKVFRIMDDDNRVEARTHRAWKLLHDRPNSTCIAHRFWATTAAQLLIYENSFLFKERDEFDEVESLYHLDPTVVRVEWDKSGKKYIIEGPPRQEYTDEQVLHIVGFSTDGYYGSSRITQAKQTLGTAIARAKFEGGFYKRGGKFPGFLKHPGRLSEQGVKNIRAQMDKWVGVDGDMHKWPVLEEGMEPVKAGFSMEEMQFAELAEQTRTEIAVLFGIPPAYLGASTGDSLTYATTESNQIQFAQMAVAPIAMMISKAITNDPSLLPWNVMYCEFVLEGLLRADMKTRAEYWEKMKAVLNLDPEFIAARENIPKEAIKPEPKPVAVPSVAGEEAANGQPAVPPQMQAMQNALKSAAQ